MLPADWLEYIAKQEKQLKRPPNPPKRRQPRVTRHQSREMSRVERQTKNPVRAIYGMENKYNSTPTKPEDWEGTREVGPGDQYNHTDNYRTGKPTIKPGIGGYTKTSTKPQAISPNKTVTRGRPSTTNYDALAAQFSKAIETKEN